MVSGRGAWGRKRAGSGSKARGEATGQSAPSLPACLRTSVFRPHPAARLLFTLVLATVPAHGALQDRIVLLRQAGGSPGLLERRGQLLSVTFPSLQEQKGRLSPDTCPWLGSVRPQCPASSQRGRGSPKGHVPMQTMCLLIFPVEVGAQLLWPLQTELSRPSVKRLPGGRAPLHPRRRSGRQPLASQRRPGSQAAAHWLVPMARPPFLLGIVTLCFD